VAGRPAALVNDESALEACIRDDALYKLMIFTFFYLLPWSIKMCHYYFLIAPRNIGENLMQMSVVLRTSP